MNLRDRFAQLWNPKDALDSLWRIFSLPAATAFLLVAGVVLVATAALVPQRPAEAFADPTVQNLWLTSLREHYGSTADWLARLGLVEVQRSVLPRIVFGLLALNLLLRMVDVLHPAHLAPLIRQAAIAEIETGEPAETSLRTLSVTLSADETAASLLNRVGQALRSRRYRLIFGESGAWLQANRFGGLLAVMYVGLILIIAGLAVSDRIAWWEDKVSLGPTQVRPLGHGTDLAAAARVSEPIYDPTASSWQDGPTELTLLREGREIGRWPLSSRVPRLHEGLLFYARTPEDVVLVQAEDNMGESLPLQTPQTGTTQFAQAVLRFREGESPRYIVVIDPRLGRQFSRPLEQKENEKYVIVPGRNLSLRVVHSPPQADEAVPTYVIEAFRGDESSPSYRQEISSRDTIQIDGDRYTFTPQRYAVLKFGQDYGLALMLGGAIAAAVGTFLAIWRRPRRLWVVARPQNGQVDLHFLMGRSGPAPAWLDDLLQSVATALNL